MITSLQNPQVKNVVKLRRRKYRDQQGKFLIEGYRALLYAINNHYPLDTLYVCPDLFLGENEPALIRRAAEAGTDVVEIAATPFEKMAARGQPEGLLAIAPQVTGDLNQHTPQPQSYYLIAEAITNPGNLGTILRSADGAGTHGVILCDPGTDLFHPDVVQASVGTFFSVPIFISSTEQTLAWCRAHHIQILSATPDTDTLYTDVDLCGSVAIVVGTERQGLTDTWLKTADFQVKLPMLGQANSLNVAMAATLLLYEVARQRGKEAGK